MSKFILWAPRVLSLIIIAFYILIVTGKEVQDPSPDEQKYDLLVSFTPAMVLLAGMIIGWKHKMTGGIIIVILGVVMTFFLRKYGSLIEFLPLATPILVTGILFILSYLYEKPQTRRNDLNK